MINITLDGFVDAVRSSVAEKGETFVYDNQTETGYKNCVYAVDHAPSCLIGHGMVKLGLPVEKFYDYDLNEDTDAESLLRALENAGEIELLKGDRNRIIRFASESQDSQDRGDSWGTALRKALFQINYK